jgi:hypothetical protein
MFDIAELKKDTPRQKTVIISCLEYQPGNEPTITFELTDDIRKKERQLTARYNRLIFEMGKKTEGTIKSDMLGYCKEMADICVVASQNLFSDGGRPAPHDKELFKQALTRYPRLLKWFADAITDALNEDEGFSKEQGEEDKKN